MSALGNNLGLPFMRRQGSGTQIIYNGLTFVDTATYAAPWSDETNQVTIYGDNSGPCAVVYAGGDYPFTAFPFDGAEYGAERAFPEAGPIHDSTWGSLALSTGDVLASGLNGSQIGIYLLRVSESELDISLLDTNVEAISGGAFSGVTVMGNPDGSCIVAANYASKNFHVYSVTGTTITHVTSYDYSAVVSRVNTAVASLDPVNNILFHVSDSGTGMKIYAWDFSTPASPSLIDSVTDAGITSTERTMTANAELKTFILFDSISGYAAKYSISAGGALAKDYSVSFTAVPSTFGRLIKITDGQYMCITYGHTSSWTPTVFFVRDTGNALTVTRYTSVDATLAAIKNLHFNIQQIGAKFYAHIGAYKNAPHFHAYEITGDAE